MILYPLFLTLLGFTPSLIWLSFYLKKDVHPEPKRMVIKVFILGMGSAFLAALLGILLSDLIQKLNLPLSLCNNSRRITLSPETKAGHFFKLFTIIF